MTTNNKMCCFILMSSVTAVYLTAIIMGKLEGPCSGRRPSQTRTVDTLTELQMSSAQMGEPAGSMTLSAALLDGLYGKKEIRHMTACLDCAKHLKPFHFTRTLYEA